MRNTIILLVFFSVFTAASLLIPTPMFPGNVLCKILESPTKYSPFLSAVFNGVFYSAIFWLTFTLLSKKFEEESSD
ncbi:hypothetical protein J7L49_06630 [Candidatus Bathyarchaeota archaeon]|nr:hypothetical protein [Candidatus Bathyarchaeota archaeon]